MHTKRKQTAQLGIISAIVLTAVSASRAADFTVDGNLKVNKDAAILGKARIDGNVGVGAANSGADLQISQTGLGVGIFLGDRAPFGQALFETDLTTPATHAFFAEMGNRVFSVFGGGDGFFKGNLEVDGSAMFKGDGSFDGLIGLTVPKGRLTIGSLPCPHGICPDTSTTGGDPLQKLTVFGNAFIEGNESIGGNASIKGSESIAGNVSFGAQTREMISLWNNGQADYGIGVQDFGFYQRTGSDFFWYQGGTHSNKLGDAGGGKLLMHLDNSGNILLGARTGQMVNLFDTTYGIGVQKSAFYQRTDNEFFWYLGGTHSDDFGDAGGGKQLMRLGNNGDLMITHSIVTPVLQITGGTDIAEPFRMSHENTPMGAVVIIDEENVGRLKPSEVAYDTRVAGIVSGANGINPGISLSQQGVTEGGQNVALSGRVYVLADASNSPIKPGDLLTTSHTPGYAMKVTDHAKAPGAVIGKAMSVLKEGKGMVLVLVTLQ